MPKEAEADVAPVDPGVDVLVHRRFHPLGDPVPEEHRQDEEQNEQEDEQASEDGKNAFHL